MTIRRHIAGLGCAMVLSACASSADREGWRTDFEQLQQHMAAVYANLEWTVQARGLDLVELTSRTEESIEGAKTRRGARKAIERFVKSFDDPHFRVQKGKTFHPAHEPAQPDLSGLPLDTAPQRALKAMGFRQRNLDFRLDLSALDGFERVRPSPGNPFAWGMLTLADGRRIGMVRIAHFGEDGYPDIAGPLWEEFAAAREGPCDIQCQWDFRYRVGDELLRHLAEGARFLAGQGIDALLVDITGNGGGTDWAAVAPRIFAPPLRECPSIGFVRHPHHGDRFSRQREHLDALLVNLSLDGPSRAMLEQARDRVAAMAVEATQPCDRMPLFREAEASLACSQLVVRGSCGALEYLPAGSLSDVELRSLVFGPLDFAYEEAVWTGPLLVLMDGRTASASEQFVSLLEANGAATLLGERTLGAGCGYIGGGVPLYLEHLDITVRMSDCIRYRADGTNELAGIEPHVPVRWDGGNRARARALAKVLESLDP